MTVTWSTEGPPAVVRVGVLIFHVDGTAIEQWGKVGGVDGLVGGVGNGLCDFEQSGPFDVRDGLGVRRADGGEHALGQLGPQVGEGPLVNLEVGGEATAEVFEDSEVVSFGEICCGDERRLLTPAMVVAMLMVSGTSGS